MELTIVDRIYNEIMLLSVSNKDILYNRIRKELYHDNEIVVYSTAENH